MIWRRETDGTIITRVVLADRYGWLSFEDMYSMRRYSVVLSVNIAISKVSTVLHSRNPPGCCSLVSRFLPVLLMLSTNAFGAT